MSRTIAHTQRTRAALEANEQSVSCRGRLPASEDGETIRPFFKLYFIRMIIHMLSTECTSGPVRIHLVGCLA